MKDKRFKEFLKKKDLSNEEDFLKKELKKIPFRRRKNALELYEQYKQGIFLVVDGKTDNKKRLGEKYGEISG